MRSFHAGAQFELLHLILTMFATSEKKKAFYIGCASATATVIRTEWLFGKRGWRTRGWVNSLSEEGTVDQRLRKENARWVLSKWQGSSTSPTKADITFLRFGMQARQDLLTRRWATRLTSGHLFSLPVNVEATSDKRVIELNTLGIIGWRHQYWTQRSSSQSIIIPNSRCLFIPNMMTIWIHTC